MKSRCSQVEWREERMEASSIQILISITTTVIAVMGLCISLYQFMKARSEDKRSQAVLIDAWWVRVDFDTDGSKNNLQVRIADKQNFDIPVKDPPRYCTGIVIRNSSSAPFTCVHVKSKGFIMNNGERTEVLGKKEPIKQALLPPGEYICLEVNGPDRQHTKYKNGWTYPESVDSFEAKIRPIMNKKTWMVKTITFTDVYGRMWKKSYKSHKLSPRRRGSRSRFCSARGKKR